MIFRKVLFTSILAAQFLAMQSAYGKIVTHTDDPFPCGNCDESQGPAQLTSAAMKLNDDPFPCGNCDESQGPAQLTSAAMKLNDDPFPCGNCDESQGPAQLS